MIVKKKLTFKEQKAKDKELVRGKFHFHEVPQGQVSFVARIYKGDPIKKYTFIDGHIYSIPLGIVKHINKNCWYPRHQFEVDKDGKKMIGSGLRKQRMSFESMEFIDTSNEDDVLTMGAPIIEEIKLTL